MSNLLAQGQERFILPIGDYTSEQSCNKLEYQTGQDIGGHKRAADTIVYGTFQLSTGNIIESGSTSRVIKKTAHGARKGDVINFTSGNNISIPVQILSCPSPDLMIIAATPEFASAIGDTFDIKRYVSPQYGSDGSLNVSVVPSPITYSRKSGGITASTTVLEDLDTPANSRAMPVVIHSIDGAPINITAGDLNVQLSDQGANPDVTKIGDGTNRLGINSNLEAKTHDADLLAQSVLLVAKDFATQTTLAAIKAKTDNLDVLLSTRTKPSDTQPVSIAASVAVTGPLTDTQLRATAVPVSGTVTVTGVATSGNQTNGTQQTKITDGTNVNTIKALSTQVVAADYGIVTNSIMHGLSSGGGGNYVDVKVNPSGALTTETTIVGTVPVSGTFFQATQPVSGTFFQATQPVSGTFFQATQPVSIASTISVVQTSIAIGTITNTQKTVGTTAVRATVSGTAPSARKKLLIKPSKNNTGAIYLGSSSVTIATGLELIGPDRMEFLNENNDYYLISDTAAQTVEILEVY